MMAVNPFLSPTATSEPGRYGYGTTPAMDQLFKQLEQTPGQMSTCVAINLVTLIRNAAGNKQVKAADVVSAVKKNMIDIATEYEEICDVKWKNFPHHILFYLVHPEKSIPVQYQRPRTSPTQALFDTATQNFIMNVKQSDHTSGSVTAHIRMAERMRLPSYKGIRDCIAEFVRPEVDLHLVSHMPLDYHAVTGTGRKGYLYRSHTGSMVKMTPSDLAQIVFGNKDVPFYPSTHVLLGDKHLIKGSLGGADKKRLIKLAADNHWGMRTNMYVDLKLKENNFILPYTI